MPPTRGPLEEALDRVAGVASNGAVRPPARVLARRRATNALLRLEFELHALAADEPRGEDLAFVLSLVRDRLAIHHLRPHAAIIEEWDWRRAA